MGAQTGVSINIALSGFKTTAAELCFSKAGRFCGDEEGGKENGY